MSSVTSWAGHDDCWHERIRAVRMPDCRRFVAFKSTAINLVPHDTNGFADALEFGPLSNY
jgi:hypothetical protein